MKSITDFFSEDSNPGQLRGNNQQNNNGKNEEIDENESTSSDHCQIIQKNSEVKKYNEGKFIRYHTFCKNLVIIDGKSYKCHYHARTNRYNANHTCKEHIKHEKQNIEEFLTSQPSIKYLDTSKLSLEDHVALVCAQLNFSIKSVCSPEFHDLLYHFIRAGQDSNKFHTYPKAYKIYQAKDRGSLRKRIINLSESTISAQCRLAAMSSPMAAALDGGSVAHNHFVDVLLNDIIYGNGTFLFESFTLPSFNAKTYMKIGKKIIDEAANSKIILSCFVGDRLRSQVKGLDHLNPNSLQNTFYDNPIYNSVVFIPCICHILNRSLLKTIQKSDNLKKAVNLLNSLQVLLRKPGFYSLIKKYMPSLVETRWIYLFDIAFWAISNKKLINSIFTGTQIPIIKKYFRNARFEIFQKGIPLIIEEVASIMLPIKIFFDKMEDSKSALWWIKPLFQQLINHLKSVENDLEILSNECKQIRTQFENDYFQFARTELIDAAFSFTSIGRNLFRQKFFENSIDDEENEYPDDIKLNFNKYLNQLTEQENKFIFEHFVNDLSSSSSNENLHVLTNPNKKSKNYEKNNEEEEEEEANEDENEYDIDDLDQQIIQNLNEKENQTINLDENQRSFSNNKLTQKTLLNYYLETIDEENSIHKKQHKTKNKTTAQKCLHHWNKLELMKNEGMYQCTLYCIKEISKIKNYDKIKRRNIIDQFNNDFRLSAEMLPNGDLIYDSNTEFWVAARYSTSLKDIAEIALYFLSLPASQSICERNISIKRCAVSKQQYRMKNDILTARARLACLKENIQLNLNK